MLRNKVWLPQKNLFSVKSFDGTITTNVKYRLFKIRKVYSPSHTDPPGGGNGYFLRVNTPTPWGCHGCGQRWQYARHLKSEQLHIKVTSVLIKINLKSIFYQLTPPISEFWIHSFLLVVDSILTIYSFRTRQPTASYIGHYGLIEKK